MLGRGRLRGPVIAYLALKAWAAKILECDLRNQVIYSISEKAEGLSSDVRKHIQSPKFQAQNTI
jgi:hypothetical protein